jgi:hypothetical protein
MARKRNAAPEPPRKWSSLSKAEKDEYKRRGVHPNTFNAWEKKSKRSLAQLARYGKTKELALGYGITKVAVRGPKSKSSLYTYGYRAYFGDGTVLDRSIKREFLPYDELIYEIRKSLESSVIWAGEYGARSDAPDTPNRGGIKKIKLTYIILPTGKRRL